MSAADTSMNCILRECARDQKHSNKIQKEIQKAPSFNMDKSWNIASWYQARE